MTPEEIEAARLAALAAATTTTTTTTAPATATTAPADEEDPDEPAEPVRTLGRGGVPMGDAAIADRAARERRKILREEYGTSDETKIAAIREQRRKGEEASRLRDEELARLKTADEERSRASMTEADRMKADLETANQTIAELKQQLTAKDQIVLQSKQSAQIQQLATTHRIKPKAVRYLEIDMGDHWKKMTKVEKVRFDGRAVDRWVRKWAQDNPEHVIEAPAPARAAEPTTEEAVPVATARTAAPVARTTVRRPIGAPPPKVATPQPRVAEKGNASGDFDPVTGKTLKPGQKNSMNHTEAQAFLAKKGIKLPYGGGSQKFQPSASAKR